MSRAVTVARTVRLFRDAVLSPAALSANLARIAIETRDQVIASGQAPNNYSTRVDGRLGAPETSVRPDGRIDYRFNLLGLAAAYAISFCKARSPVRSGAYKQAWRIVVDGRPLGGGDDLDDIAAAAEVMVVNPLPYARKIETGGMKMSVPPGIVEAARLATRQQFASLSVDTAYVNIPSGLLGKDTPWILRNRAGSRRKDRQAGTPITYPALILKGRS